MVKKVKFISSDEWLVYALFVDKEYEVIFESDENYLIANEVNGNSIVPKDKFIEIE